MSLAWLLEQPTITAPIASATSTEQMEALFAAVDLKLSAAQVALLTDASAYLGRREEGELGVDAFGGAQTVGSPALLMMWRMPPLLRRQTVIMSWKRTLGVVGASMARVRKTLG